MTPFIRKIAMPGLAATLAVTVALSPLTAPPAKADPNPGAAVALGAIALMFGAAIASGATASQNGRAGAGAQHRPDDRRATPTRPDRAKLLPESCTFTIRHGEDRGTYASKLCLMRNYDNWTRLPNRCEERVTSRQTGTLRAYDTQCLARYGYSVSDNDWRRDARDNGRDWTRR